MNLRLASSIEDVEAGRAVPLDGEGSTVDFPTEALATYEVVFRLEPAGRTGAVLQFSTPSGGRIGQAVVAPRISEELGRHWVLETDAKTGIGKVRFCGARKLNAMKLRFRCAPGAAPLMIGEEISITKIAGPKAESSKPSRAQAKAAQPKPQRKRASFIKTALKTLLDRVFLRSKIAKTHDDFVRFERGFQKTAGALDGRLDFLETKTHDEWVRFERGFEKAAGALADRLAQIERRLGADVSVAESRVVEFQHSLETMFELLEKRLEFLEVKLDVYAEVADTIDKDLRSHFMDRHSASDARLGVVGDSLARSFMQGVGTVVEKTDGMVAERIEAIGGRIDEKIDDFKEAFQNRLAHLEYAIAVRSEADDASLRTQLRELQATYDARLNALAEDNGAAVNRLDDRASQMTAGLESQADDIVRRVEKSARTQQARLEKILFNESRQAEALDALNRLLDLETPLPATRGWAASPDVLLHLYLHITQEKPRTIVELGSGVSTLVAAAALAANGEGGIVYSLDHDAAYAQQTRAILERHGLGRFAVVYDAPLSEWTAPAPTELGEKWLWYTVPYAVKVLAEIDLLFVDGPPEASGDHARYPAGPQFAAQLSSSAVILLDDAARPHEQESAEAWSRDQNLSLKLLQRFDREFEKGLAVLRV